MNNTTHPRRIVDIDKVIADMRGNLAVAKHLDDVFDDHKLAIDTLEATIAEVRRILAQAEPASKDVADMRGAEWALKCVRSEMRDALRGE